MADYDLTALDETRPDGAIDQVLVLDDAEKETRRKLKAFVDVEHDLLSGGHTFVVGATAPATPVGYQLWFNTDTGELLIYDISITKWVPAQQPTFNYLYNPSFSRYPNVTSMPTGWSKYGTSTNSTVTITGSGQADIHQKFGATAVGINSGNGYIRLYQWTSKAGSYFAPATYWCGRTATLGCWVFCNTPNAACIILDTQVSSTFSPFHPGDSTWRWMTATYKTPLGSSPTGLGSVLAVEIPGVTAYFSAPTLVEGSWCPRVVPSGIRTRSYVLQCGSNNGNADTVPNSTVYYGPQGVNASSPFFACANLPFRALLSNLRVYISNGAGAGQSVVATVSYNGSDTPLKCTIFDVNTFNFDNVNKVEVDAISYISLKVVSSATALVSAVRASILVEEVPEYLL